MLNPDSALNVRDASKMQLSGKLSYRSEISLETELRNNTIKVMDESDERQRFYLRTPKIVASPQIFDNNRSLESLVNSAANSGSGEDQDPPNVKIDLSNVSFLKPHIVNTKIYELAHKGFLREDKLKPDAVKSLEQ